MVQNIIDVSNLSKSFDISTKEPGLKGTIKHFFKTLGLEVYVVPVASADPKVKAKWIEKNIKKGYDTIYFSDDSIKNIKAVEKLKKVYPKVTIKTYHVKQEDQNAT